MGVEIELKESKNAGDKLTIFLDLRQFALPAHTQDEAAKLGKLRKDRGMRWQLEESLKSLQEDLQQRSELCDVEEQLGRVNEEIVKESRRLDELRRLEAEELQESRKTCFCCPDPILHLRRRERSKSKPPNRIKVSFLTTSLLLLIIYSPHSGTSK